MENATKALLIAAAVLIVIVLIALGVALLNSGSDVTGQAKSVGESTAVQTFNGQFTAYLGKRQNASTVRALVVAVKASNNNSGTEVTINGSKEGYSPDDGKFYEIKVDATDYYDDGRIKNIRIIAPTTTTPSGT